MAAALHAGGCHCGAIRFEVEIDASRGSRCNCTICQKTGALSGRVKPRDFKLLAGEESVATYAWGGKIMARTFCKRCGVHCYCAGHLAAMGGDFVSVNLNTLDDFDPRDVEVGYWDGRHNNWQAGMRDAPWPLEAPVHV